MANSSTSSALPLRCYWKQSLSLRVGVTKVGAAPTITDKILSTNGTEATRVHLSEQNWSDRTELILQREMQQVACHGMPTWDKAQAGESTTLYNKEPKNVIRKL